MEYYKEKQKEFNEFSELPQKTQDEFLGLCILRAPISLIYNASLAKNYNDIELANALKEDLKNHFEMRIQLFFLKLLTSYKTNFIFDSFKTYLQAGTENKGSSHDLVEAHSDLLASLSYETLKNKNDHFINFEDEESTLDPKAYGAFSSFQKIWNSTVKLPRFVNEVDSSIERISKNYLLNNSFREYCITILNYNATGELSPEKQGLLIKNT